MSKLTCLLSLAVINCNHARICISVHSISAVLPSSDYDDDDHVNSMQLIVWAPTRAKAIERMKRALEDTIITGKRFFSFSISVFDPQY